LLPDVDDARTSELLEVWHRHVDEQQQEVLAGRRPYASSTVIDLEAATLVAADADISAADAVRSLAASGQRLSRGRTLSRRWTGSPRNSRWSACRTPATRRSPASARTPGFAGTGCSRPKMRTATNPFRRLPTAIINAGCSPDRPAHGRCPCLGPSRCTGCRHRTACVERPVRDPPSAMDSFDLHAKSLDDLAISLNATYDLTPTERKRHHPWTRTR
jgi:2-haloacid dehalogenase